jgi:hypothetical protein
MTRSFLAGLLAVLSLAACDPRLTYESNLSLREVQTLAGVWEGQSGITWSDDNDCPRFYVWAFRVANGNVEGDVVDRATPNAPRAKFTTFLDYDGSMTATARAGGRDTLIRGAFQRDSFVGEAKSKACSYRLRLRRTASS